MSFMTILTIFSMPLTVSAVETPDTPRVIYCRSYLKGQLLVAFNSIVNKKNIQKINDYDKKKNAMCDGYQIKYSTSKDFSSSKYKTFSWEKANHGKISHIYVNSLTKNKTYYVKLRSYNKNGSEKVYSPWSDVYSIKINSQNSKDVELVDSDLGHYVSSQCGLPYGTGYNDTCHYVFNEGCNHYGSRNTEKVKLSKPKSVKKIENYKSLKISWKSVENADGYQIKYATNKSFKNAEKELISGKDETSINLTGLKGNKKYYVKVRAYISTGSDSRKYGSYSSVITGISRVTKPSGVKVTAGKKKITIKYKDIEGYNEIYQIKYSTDKSFKNAKFVKTEKFKKTLNNLKSNKTYYIKIKAKTLDAITDKVVSTSAYTKTFKCKTK